VQVGLVPAAACPGLGLARAAPPAAGHGAGLLAPQRHRPDRPGCRAGRTASGLGVNVGDASFQTLGKVFPVNHHRGQPRSRPPPTG
jgi:hypothetical protein